MAIPISKPWFGEEEREAILKPLDTGWVAQGPNVQAFERAVGGYCDAQFAIACSSGTAALHLALVAAGIGPGDEVIVPSFTYVASANAVHHTGATPVFADIDPRTFNIDLSTARVSENTKAIMPVHLFGLMANIDAVMAFAETHNLIVIEDAACALGSRFNGKHAGTFGVSGCFSFHPRKSITTGEGGMVITNDAEMAATLFRLRDHGRDGARYLERGFNYRLTDIQGALGAAQMKRLDEIIDKKRRIAARYDVQLKLTTPFVPDGHEHAYQAYVCRADDRDALMTRLDAKGISTRPGTHAAHALEAYGFPPEHCPNAWEADRHSIALPLFPTMTDDEADAVIAAVNQS